jgi:spore maturation protein CgeB
LPKLNQFSPDILFVDDYSTYTFEFINQIKNECPSIKFVIGWCGAPFNDKKVFKSYDLVLSNIPSLVNYFQQQGHKSKYLRHAFEPKF